MASVTWGDTFSGSGALAGSAVEIGTGSWFSDGGSGLARSASGATHAAGAFDESIDLALSGARGTGVSVYEFSVYGDPVIQLRTADYPMVYVALNSAADSVDFLATNDSFSDDFGSASIAHPGYATLSVVRIEIETSTTRFYLNGSLLGTLSVGLSTSFAFDVARIRYRSGAFGRDELLADSVLLKYIHFKTETASGALGAPGGTVEPPATTAKISFSELYGITSKETWYGTDPALWDVSTPAWTAFVPPGTTITIDGVEYEFDTARSGVDTAKSALYIPQANGEQNHASGSRTFDQRAGGMSIEIPLSLSDAFFSPPAGVTPVPKLLSLTVEGISAPVLSYLEAGPLSAGGQSRYLGWSDAAVSYQSLIPSPRFTNVGGGQHYGQLGTYVSCQLRAYSYPAVVAPETNPTLTPLELQGGPVAGAYVVAVVVVDFLTPQEIADLDIVLGPDAGDMPEIDASLPADEQREEGQRVTLVRREAKKNLTGYSDFWTRFNRTYEVP